jgi:hypothetical protein
LHGVYEVDGVFDDEEFDFDAFFRIRPVIVAAAMVVVLEKRKACRP